MQNFFFFLFIISIGLIYLYFIKKSKSYLPNILHPLSVVLYSFVVTFYIHLIYDNELLFNSYDNNDLVKFITLTFISLLAILLGFSISFNLGLNNFKNKKYLNTNTSINVLVVIFILGICSNIYDLIYNAGGYQIFNDDINFETNIFLKFIIQAKDIAFFLLFAFYFFDNNKRIKNIFLILLLLNLTVSLLSGFKGSVFSILITYLIFYYLKNKKISIVKIIVLGIFMILSTLFIEGYRTIKKFDKTVNFTKIFNPEVLSEIKDNDLLKQMAFKYIDRNNLLSSSCLAIKYYQNGYMYDKTKPEFFKKIFLSPALGFIPRTIWKDKPINIDGLWYTSNVIGSPYITFTPAGKIIYLYFAGGTLFVFLGFLFIGILLRILIKIYSLNTYFSKAIYVQFLLLITNLEMSIDYFLINLYYNILIFLLIFLLIKILSKIQLTYNATKFTNY
jgi:hypothetical protein